MAGTYGALSLSVSMYLYFSLKSVTHNFWYFHNQEKHRKVGFII